MRKAAILLTIALAGCSIGSGGNDVAGGGGVATTAPTASQSQAAAKLGFPTVATRNTIRVGGADPYATAAAIDRFFTAIKGKPSPHVIVASGEQAPYAMPAAAWAARSGDSILFTQRNHVPAVTLQAIRAHSKPDIYVLGPESV